MRGSRCRATGVALVAVILAGCGGGDGGEQAGSGPSPVRYGVGLRTETFVDTSRVTGARGRQPEMPSRTLVTDVYYPAPPASSTEPKEGAPSAAKPGGYPLVLFAHGSGSNPTFYRVLLRSWAAAGYVVAAPAFPLSSTMLRDSASDVVNQPKDATFVISEMLRLSSDPQSPLAGTVDASRIAVSGHSLGAMTAMGAAYNSCCRDPRIKAAIVLAGSEAPYPDGTYFTGGAGTPLLVIHGEADRTIPIAEGERIFAEAPAPKVLLILPTSDLPSIDHVAPYVGSNGSPIQPTLLVITATVGFLDQYLGDRPDSLAPLRSAVDQEVGYRLQIVES